MLSKQAQRTLLGAGRKELSRTTLRNNARTLATPAAKPPSPNDPFANGTNAYYAEEMYRVWREDPKAVHASWNAYFSGMDKGMPSHQAFTPPPSIVITEGGGLGPALYAPGGRDIDDHMKVFILVVGSWIGADASLVVRPNCSFVPTRFADTTSPTLTHSGSSTPTSAARRRLSSSSPTMASPSVTWRRRSRSVRVFCRASSRKSARP
jgi:hypothetical protein